LRFAVKPLNIETLKALAYVSYSELIVAVAIATRPVRPGCGK
jgi:hypothetical protein